MAVKMKAQILLEFFESATGDLGEGVFPQRWYPNSDAAANGGKFTRANGSGSGQVQVLYSDSNSVANGAPVTYDLRGALASAFGVAALAFNPLVGIAVRNKSTAAGEKLQIGAGSNPITTLWGASGDIGIAGPGGFFLTESPIDGFATTAGTADILQIAAASGTISFDLVIWGR